MTWEENVERWQLGFESSWICDQLVQRSRPNGPYFEAWSLLAGLPARTEKIRIGVLVTSNTFRYPPVVARMAVTIDARWGYFRIRGEFMKCSYTVSAALFRTQLRS